MKGRAKHFSTEPIIKEVGDFTNSMGKYHKVRKNPLYEIQKLVARQIDIMAMDTSRNANEKVKRLLSAMVLIAEREGESLDSYMEELTNLILKYLMIKKSNMNIVLLLQTILKDFLPKGFERVPEALRTIKENVAPSPSYLSFLNKKVEGNNQIFDLDGAPNEQVVLAFEYLRNYESLPVLNPEQKENVLDNLPKFWEMGPLAKKNYDLNAVMKGYDMLVDKKDPVRIEQLGNALIHFLSRGK